MQNLFKRIFIYHFLVLLFACNLSEMVAQQLLNPIKIPNQATAVLDSSLIPFNLKKSAIERVTIKDGHLHTESGGRLRLFGTIINGEACFPDSALAIVVAKRLRSLGYNSVRLKNFDYSNYNAASVLQNTSTNSSDGLDSNQMKRFDWFIHQLKSNGIYVYLTLHSNRTARRNDGIPRWDSIPSNGVIVNYTDSLMQEKSIQFVRLLLTHTNRYTGFQYKDDPVIALVDLDEGNSLYSNWIANNLHTRSEGGTGAVSWFYARRIDTLWTKWLLKRYGSEQQINTAWTSTASSTSNIVTKNNGFEDAFDNTWTMSTFGGGAFAVTERDPVDKKEGSFSMRIRIQSPGTAANNITYYNGSPALEKYRLYRIQFWSRTSVTRRNVTFSIANFSIRDSVLQAWREHNYVFRSNTTSTTRFNIQCGIDQGDVWIDDVRITPISESGLLPTDTVSKFIVRRPRYNETIQYSTQRWIDENRFYLEATESFYNRLKDLIRITLKSKVLISGQNSISLANDIYAQREMDFTTATTQWDFRRRIPNSPSDTMWYILNDAMLVNRSGGLIGNAARAIIEGKPFILNSHAMPYPYENINELTTIMPAYMAYNDADGFFLNNYTFTRSLLNASYIAKNAHYEQVGNPALQATIPSIAHAFINGLITPSQQTIPIRQTSEALTFPPFHQAGLYFLEGNIDSRVPLFRRTAIDSFVARLQTFRPQLEIPALADPSGVVNTRNLKSETNEIVWNADDTLFTINTPRFILINGALRDKIVDVQPFLFERRDKARFGTVSVLSLDSVPLSDTWTYLLTMSTRSNNVGNTWDGDSSTYRNWGNNDMVTELMSMNISAKATGDSITIQPLDSLGNPSFPAYGARKIGSSIRFVIDQSQTPTYWFKIRQHSKTTGVSITDEDKSLRFQPLESQPLQHDTKFELISNEGGRTEIKLLSIDGREIPIEKYQYFGTITQGTIPVSMLPNGIYFLVANNGIATATQRFIILR